MVSRAGYVALIGAPNVGKSTLLNALTGSKISIVTPKPQTTRAALRGIVNEGESQIIFVDTPGIFDAKPRFEKAMVSAAWSGAAEADVLMVVVDANRGLDNDTRSVLEALKARGSKAVLVLNKIDKVEKPHLLELAKTLYDLFDFERSFMVSAMRGDGIKDVLHYLVSRMPESVWLYPEDQTTDMSERSIAAEITREQCFLRLRDELPYSLMVETEKWQEKVVKNTRTITIHQIVVLTRESHKKIILGAKGAMLKAIGSSARRKIGEVLGADVNLFLFVKIDETWKDNPESYKAAGLEYKK